jgi:MFS family permease
MALVMSTSTLAGASLALVFPLAALVMAAHGWSNATIGANAAVHGLGIFVIGPFIGRMIGGIGAVRCFQLSLLLAAGAVLAMPLVVEPWLWFPLRLAIGCASGLLFVISEAAVNALAPEAQRGRIIGVYATLFSLGYAAGPLVVAVGGHEGWPPFLLAAGILLLGLLPASYAIAADAALRGHARPRGLLGVPPRAPLAIATILVFGLSEAAFFGLLPIWGLAIGIEPRSAALLLSVWIAGNIVLQLPLGWLADRLGRRLLLFGCLVVSITALVLMNPSAGRPLLLWPLLIVMGATMGGLYTLSLALLGQAFRGPEQPMANTAFIMVFELGVVLGPAMTGLVMETGGATTLPWVTIVPMLLLMLAFPRLRSPAISP